ncbi:TPA: YdbL family protein [Photobacterium damselae]|uniref:YdbL family protein n=1 Tax=Photobacterium damselae TaxID=38293 RepID=UPI001594BFBD|nr:YdbL family protein [Photobacterium damselae]NVH47312.1 YdbL family protein [Photobacterium damselae subsp. damselae]
MKRITLFLCALLFSVNAFAISLQQAKSQGLVGEANNGYIAIVTGSPSAEVKRLIQQVNQQRKSKYQSIGSSHGLSVNEVARLAYKKAVSKTPRGQYYQSTTGQWVKK